MKRVHQFKRVFFGMLLSLMTLAIVAVSYQATRTRLADSLLEKVDRLVMQPPENVQEIEWAMLVYHTHNLHCAAMPQIEMSLKQLNALNHELDKMLATGPDRDSIDHLWGEYSRLTEGGSRYREIYEPERDARIATAKRDGDTYFDLRSYTDFVDSFANTHSQ